MVVWARRCLQMAAFVSLSNVLFHFNNLSRVHLRERRGVKTYSSAAVLLCTAGFLSTEDCPGRHGRTTPLPPQSTATCLLPVPRLLPAATSTAATTAAAAKRRGREHCDRCCSSNYCCKERGKPCPALHHLALFLALAHRVDYPVHRRWMRLTKGEAEPSNSLL